MEENMFQLLLQEKQKKEIETIISINEKTRQFGLTLTKEAAEELIISRNLSLKKYQRVEMGAGILEKLVFAFCDSGYLIQQNYAESLMRLQDIFYEFKNEALDLVTDDELLTFMREQFDDVCFGDFDYLEGTCLDKFAFAIRAGYCGYKETGGQNEYSKLDDIMRWDRELYLSALAELFWE